MININKKKYKLTTLLIMLCLCFVVTGCKKNVQSSQDGWTCICGTVNTSNFCSNCGKQKGEQQEQKEQKQATNLNPFKNAEVGDYVKFGSYPQTAEGEEQSIEWQVLAKENNKMLVISRYGLEAKRFDNDSNVWANSEIRQWLNGDFYNNVFTENEKKYIKPFEGDNVFFLSKEEVENYFANDDERKCKPTDYAKNNGACIGINGYGLWWLRSVSSYDTDLVYYVYNDGIVGYDTASDTTGGVRPALWINL